jgi:hypothetical protein
MATIFSNANGHQVVKARDVYGDYFYLANGLGTPTIGAYSDEDAAVAALDDPHAPEPDLEMDDKGCRLVGCAYCGQSVRPGESVPEITDAPAWEAEASQHGDNCEWVRTRAHR